jgi:hydroxymethylpyrimidine/phosphomethylpyrimidine kinase
MKPEVLSGLTVTDNEFSMVRARETIANEAGTAVLVKGGHSVYSATDFLCRKEKAAIEFPSKRVENPNTHGTGCTLSSAAV